MEIEGLGVYSFNLESSERRFTEMISEGRFLWEMEKIDRCDSLPCFDSRPPRLISDIPRCCLTHRRCLRPIQLCIPEDKKLIL